MTTHTEAEHARRLLASRRRHGPGRRALSAPLPDELITAEQFTFLGRDWAYGLALEAGLKMREACRAWTEAYPAMEYPSSSPPEILRHACESLHRGVR